MFGKFDGFLARYDVSSPDEYVGEYGWVKFFTEGPIADYAHLTSIPAFLGLIFLMYYKTPSFIQKLVGKARNTKKKRAKTKRKNPDGKDLGVLGKFTFIVIFIQLFPVIIGIDVSPTWLSDFVMITMYGYAIMTSGVLFGMVFGLYRAISGGILHQRDYD